MAVAQQTYQEYVRAKMCGDKTKFVDKPAAKEALSSHPNRKILHVYDCPYCDYFHIGHKPKGRQLNYAVE